MGVFDRLFGKGDARAARRAELSGDLAGAVVLWGDAGRPEEAARVMILRGDAETDARVRLQHYTQAAGTAPEGHETNKAARRKRALLTMTLAGEGAISMVARADVLSAAKDLEAIGDSDKAAEAYALAGDLDGEARALAKAGDVDRLEELLQERQAKDRESRNRTLAHGQIEMLASSGRRREALQAATAFLAVQPEDESVRQRAHALEGRRVKGPVARLVLRGTPLCLVLGDEVVIGRTEGSLTLASHAISRRHLSITRSEGQVRVKDLGSRNGTQLRGMTLVGEASVGEGLELSLGREVPFKIAPSATLEGAVEIELGGERYVAPLGAAKLGIGTWRIEPAAEDGWLELVTDESPPAMIDGMALVPRVTLLVGDAIASERGASPVLRVLG